MSKIAKNIFLISALIGTNNIFKGVEAAAEAPVATACVILPVFGTQRMTIVCTAAEAVYTAVDCANIDTAQAVICPKMGVTDAQFADLKKGWGVTTLTKEPALPADTIPDTTANLFNTCCATTTVYSSYTQAAAKKQLLRLLYQISVLEEEAAVTALKTALNADSAPSKAQTITITSVKNKKYYYYEHVEGQTFCGNVVTDAGDKGACQCLDFDKYSVCTKVGNAEFTNETPAMQGMLLDAAKWKTVGAIAPPSPTTSSTASTTKKGSANGQSMIFVALTAPLLMAAMS